VTQPLNPQGLNRYSYVQNNPLRYLDPSGFQYCTVVQDAVVCDPPLISIATPWCLTCTSPPKAPPTPKVPPAQAVTTPLVVDPSPGGPPAAGPPPDFQIPQGPTPDVSEPMNRASAQAAAEAAASRGAAALPVADATPQWTVPFERLEHAWFRQATMLQGWTAGPGGASPELPGPSSDEVIQQMFSELSNPDLYFAVSLASNALGSASEIRAQWIIRSLDRPSAKGSALQRLLQPLANVRALGKGAFVVGVTVSGAQAFEAFSHRKDVAGVKALLDAGVAYGFYVAGGVPGLVGGAVYFIIDYTTGWDYLMAAEGESGIYGAFPSQSFVTGGGGTSGL
jgi:hypothetical protein